jgi:hypothetical protein
MSREASTISDSAFSEFAQLWHRLPADVFHRQDADATIGVNRRYPNRANFVIPALKS